MTTDRPVHPETFERIRGLLETALGAHIGVACTGVDGDPQTLFPEEHAAIARAVTRRQREFAAGRAAVREAMGRIGLEPGPVPSGPDRAPVWPPGLTGSISHTRQICVAAIGWQQAVGTVGIDVEERAPIDPDLWPSICTPEEHQYLQTQPAGQRGHLVTLLFSAKEAFYKWQYPLTRVLLDFQDVTVQLNEQRTGFAVRLVNQARCLEHLSRNGGFVEDSDCVITWVYGHPDHDRTGAQMAA